MSRAVSAAGDDISHAIDNISHDQRSKEILLDIDPVPGPLNSMNTQILVGFAPSHDIRMPTGPPKGHVVGLRGGTETAIRLPHLGRALLELGSRDAVWLPATDVWIGSPLAHPPCVEIGVAKPWLPVRLQGSCRRSRWRHIRPKVCSTSPSLLRNGLSICSQGPMESATSDTRPPHRQGLARHAG
jgi:hypothetical protein